MIHLILGLLLFVASFISYKTAHTLYMNRESWDCVYATSVISTLFMVAAGFVYYLSVIQ